MQVDDSKHAGESMQERASMSTHDGWGLNEFQVSFRSLLKYAPWFNKVYVLVNGPAHPPTWAANETRLVMVDRCTLFPRGSGDCPTYNSYACNSVAHLIPGLKEHFVYMEDDYYFVRPVNSSQFFSPVGTPLVDFSLNTDSFEEVYGARADLSGPDMPPEHLPLHMINDDTIGQHASHSPMPMRVSFLKSMESKFSDWFAFLRSHRHRFQCCDVSKRVNGWREDYKLVYYWMLFANKAGEQRPGCRGTPCKCDEPLCVVDCLRDPNTMVINFNDQSVENWRIVHDLVVQRMESFIVPSWFSSWRVWPQSSRFQLWQHLLASPILMATPLGKSNAFQWQLLLGQSNASWVSEQWRLQQGESSALAPSARRVLSIGVLSIGVFSTVVLSIGVFSKESHPKWPFKGSDATQFS